jgi:hypothetical protein
VLRASTAGPTTSAERRVDVAQAVSAVLSTSAVREDTPATLSGTVAPARPGGRVVLQAQSRGTWRPLATTTQSAAGGYRFTVTPSAPGWWRFCVATPAGPEHLGAERALPALDAYRLHTYVVARRGRAVPDLRAFADAVAATYADPRGWRAAHRRFAQVASGGDLTVVLAEARYLPTYSRACSVGRYVVVNETRWRRGSPAFTGPLTQYRAMVVNHETGHWLGLGHTACPRRGAPAPVMQQQSKDLQGCAPNAWPLASELARATPAG